MLKRFTITAAFIGALALGSLGLSSQAQAGHDHHCHVPPVHPRSVYYPHHRSVYYSGYHPRAYGYSSYYGGGPAFYHGYGGSPYRSYSRGPAFRLSIGF